jgi:hypothetical protein
VQLPEREGNEGGGGGTKDYGQQIEYQSSTSA